jgi:hypothetical protein
MPYHSHYRLLGLGIEVEVWEIIKGKYNRSSEVAVQGLIFVAHPLCIHTYMHTWEINVLEVRVDGRKIRHSFHDNSGPVSGVTELKVAF